MYKLVFASIIWAFSFSFIGVYLSGKVDSYLAILIRFSLASIVLTPFLNTKGLSKTFLLKILGIGALQIGMMYIFFYRSFHYLSVPEVILFTGTTPLIIEIVGSIINKKINKLTLLAIFSSIIGAGIIRYKTISSDFLFGLFLVQMCNLCFALGQILYKNLLQKQDRGLIADKNVFALFFYGATLFILPFSVFLSDFEKIPKTNIQFSVLIWLGVIASAIGYLLWNSGARKVSYGLLASMNNLIIPLGVTVNYLLWDKHSNLSKLVIGSFFILIPIFFLQIKNRREIEV